jgi:hypothetical protein
VRVERILEVAAIGADLERLRGTGADGRKAQGGGADDGGRAGQHGAAAHRRADRLVGQLFASHIDPP